jgi:hypothetical protein
MYIVTRTDDRNGVRQSYVLGAFSDRRTLDQNLGQLLDHVEPGVVSVYRSQYNTFTAGGCRAIERYEVEEIPRERRIQRVA